MKCPICKDEGTKVCFHLQVEMNAYLVRKRIIQMWHKNEISTEDARMLDAKNTFELVDKINKVVDFV